MSSQQEITDRIYEKIDNRFAFVQQRIDCDIDENGNLNQNSIIIYGDTQTGKTRVGISLALYFMTMNYSVLFVIRNNLFDLLQLEQRIVGVQQQNIIPEVFDCARGRKAPRSKFNRSISGKSPNIFLALRNTYDLRTILHRIERAKRCKLILIIDECDEADIYQSQANEVLRELRDLCSYTIGLSATPIGSLLTQEIPTTSLIRLGTLGMYQGFSTIEYHDVGQAKFTSRIDQNLFDNNEYISKFLDDFSQQPLPCSSIHTTEQTRTNPNHPLYCLIRVGSTINPNENLANAIVEKYPNITCITLAGTKNGLTLRGNSIGRKMIGSLTGTIKRIADSRIYYHKLSNNIHISKVIAQLHQHGDVRKFPRIIVIAGQLAGRGLTFCADNFDYCYRTKSPLWRLTDLYATFSPKTTLSNILQCCGRLNGNFVGNVQRRLHCNCVDDVIRAINLPEELITRAQRFSREDFRTTIERIEIAQDKCSKRKFAGVENVELNLVADDSPFDGIDWSTTFESKTGRLLSQKIQDQIVKRTTIGCNKINITNEIDRLIKKMFPSWFNPRNQTGIAKFVRKLQSNRTYTEKELQELAKKCGYQQFRAKDMVEYLNQSNSTNRRGYGQILQTEGPKKYSMWKPIRQHFESFIR